VPAQGTDPCHLLLKRELLFRLAQQAYLAPGEGVEPPHGLIQSQAPYLLGYPGIKVRLSIEGRTTPLYGLPRFGSNEESLASEARMLPVTLQGNNGTHGGTPTPSIFVRSEAFYAIRLRGHRWSAYRESDSAIHLGKVTLFH
jgi:hypothetical protein